ncbi:Haloacid dehalogenase [Spraguea lophii 42_110]|uniref:Haloacid dehalogenase n=1 Tax=Spraguea lophii (strain 42_110) TaxID=1358809 RepID=S7WAT7_SPRLO|nr:Haloacid dehalogenase [Spraguea lophii 42_110]
MSISFIYLLFYIIYGTTSEEQISRTSNIILRNDDSISPSSISSHIRSMHSEYNIKKISIVKVTEKILDLFDNGYLIVNHVSDLIKNFNQNKITLKYDFSITTKNNEEIKEIYQNKIDMFCFNEYLQKTDCDEKEKILVFDLDNTLYPYADGEKMIGINRWYKSFTEKLKKQKSLEKLKKHYEHTKCFKSKKKQRSYSENLDQLDVCTSQIRESDSLRSFNKCIELTKEQKAEEYLKSLFKSIFGRHVTLRQVYEILIYSIYKANFRLKEILKVIRHRKIIMSNGSLRHCILTLTNLQILDSFEAIFYRDTSITAIKKPHYLSYFTIMERYRLSDSKNFIFFDDKIANIEEAKLCGWTTIFIDGKLPTEDKIYNMIRKNKK